MEGDRVTEPECPRCTKPIHDTAYACTSCASDLVALLTDTAAYAGMVTLTVAKIGRINRRMGEHQPEPDLGKQASALHPTPLLVDLRRAERHDAAVNTLHTWARHIAEERGRDLPTQTAYERACGHPTCRLSRLGLRDRPAGPPCPPPSTPPHPLAVVLMWLTEHVEWLRHRQEADEAFDELESACQTIERVVDRDPDERVVGRCPCGTYLNAKGASQFVQCRGCGTNYDINARREQLRHDLEDRLLTGAQIATMAAHLGLFEQREQARKLIKLWGDRGRITPHTTIEGAPAYQFGEVLQRLIAARARSA